MHPIKRSELKAFFREAHRYLTRAMRRQKLDAIKHASDFNLVDLIEPDENRLSDVLADLLNPTGKHGQGDLFLRQFLKQLGPSSRVGLKGKATVAREALTHANSNYRRRIDVLIDSGDLLAIENKLDSPEQEDQVRDYLYHLRRVARKRKTAFALVYLTPDGRQPKSLSEAERQKAAKRRELICLGYKRELTAWLNACCDKCYAAKIRFFLSDLITYIETRISAEQSKLFL